MPKNTKLLTEKAKLFIFFLSLCLFAFLGPLSFSYLNDIGQ